MLPRSRFGVNGWETKRSIWCCLTIAARNRLPKRRQDCSQKPKSWRGPFHATCPHITYYHPSERIDHSERFPEGWNNTSLHHNLHTRPSGGCYRAILAVSLPPHAPDTFPMKFPRRQHYRCAGCGKTYFSAPNALPLCEGCRESAEPVTIQLSVAERKRLKAQATIRDCTVEQVLRDAIAAFCDHGKGEPKASR